MVDLKSCRFILLYLLLAGSLEHRAYADGRIVLRDDAWTSEYQNSHHLIFKMDYSIQFGRFRFFGDGFFDAALLKHDEFARRSISRGSHQELYLEYQASSSWFYRLGTQAMRWSEMWTLPSLDIWTGRRYERYFVDPTAEQLSHSTGARASYVGTVWSWDLVLIPRLAVTTYPEPLPVNNEIENESPSYGTKLSYDSNGYKGSLLLAKRQTETWAGASVNYAFESWVPKFEMGVQKIPASQYISEKNEVFGSLGADVFIDDFVLTPQLTLFDFGELNKDSRNFQSAYFLGLSRQTTRFDFQLQLFRNTTYQDDFYSMYLGWFVRDDLTVGSFVQYYNGEDNVSLYDIIKDQMGRNGTLVGIRIEFAKGI